MQTEVTYSARPPSRRMKSTVSTSARASTTPAPPGTQIRSSGGQFSNVQVGRMPRPRSLETGCMVFATTWVLDLRERAGNGDRGRRSKPAQDFKRTGEVELCDSREDHEADVEIGHDTLSSKHLSAKVLRNASLEDDALGACPLDEIPVVGDTETRTGGNRHAAIGANRLRLVRVARRHRPAAPRSACPGRSAPSRRSAYSASPPSPPGAPDRRRDTGRRARAPGRNARSSSPR